MRFALTVMAIGIALGLSPFPASAKTLSDRQVAQLELAEDGNVRILVDVPTKDAKWLRSSSIFTMEKALVGGTKIKAYSGVLTDPPLEDGAVRQVLSGDAAAEIPGIVASIKELIGNLNALTNADAPLPQSLVHLQGTAAKLNGPQGAMGLLLGNKTARKIGGQALTYGGLAALGVLAYKAYGNWQSQQAGAPQGEPQTLDRLPAAQAEQHSQAILKALVAAAKADGHIDDRERQLIEGEFTKLDNDQELQHWLHAELNKPLDPADIAKSATTAEMATAPASVMANSRNRVPVKPPCKPIGT